MKKLLLSVPVALLVAWGGASWYIGQQTESALQQFIDQQNESSAASGISQELVSYEKSAFGATAVTKMTAETPPLDEMIGEVRFINEIQNGPVFFGGAELVEFGMSRIHTTLDMDSLGEEQRKVIEQVFAGKAPLEANSIINFDGSTRYEVSSSPLKSDMEGLALEIDSMTMSGVSSQDMTGDISVQTGKISLSDPASHFTIPSMTVTGKITGMVGGQMLGNFDIKAPQVSALSAGATEAFVFDLGVQADSELEEDGLTGRMALQMDNIQGSNDMLSKLHYKLDFAGMDVEGLSEINRLQAEMQSLQSQLDWDSESMETPEGRQKIQEVMDGMNNKVGEIVTVLFGKVLKTDKTRLHNVLHAESPNGNLDADIDLTYLGKGEPDMNVLASYGPDEWAQMFRGKLVLDADKSILTMGLDMLLKPYVQQGLMSDEGEKFSTSVELDGSDTIRVNSQQMAFSELLQMFGLNMQEPGQGEGNPAADLGIPEDLMEKINNEGLTPEVMQILEESDDVPQETVDMLRQLRQMQEEMQSGGPADGQQPAEDEQQ